MDATEEESTGEALAKPAPIVFSAQVEKSAIHAAIEEERLKHQKRAQRFGTTFQEPNKKLVLPPSELKRALHNRAPGFITGIDLFSQEEKQKREARARKFGPITAEADMGPAPTEAERQRRAKRAQRFGPMSVDDAMDCDLRDTRRDVGPDVERRWNAIHLYGTDDMSTTDILRYFGSYGPSWVDWVNDSSCNVVFEDVHTAKRALAGSTSAPVTLTVNPPSDADPSSSAPEPAPGPSANGAATASSDAAPAAAPAAADAITNGDDRGVGWYHGLPAPKAQALIMRYATVEDVKLPLKERPPSRWDRFSRGRGRRRGRGRGGGGGSGDVKSRLGKRAADYIDDEDDDGDAEAMEMDADGVMKKKVRGGKKVRKREAKRARGVDVEMEDAEEEDADEDIISFADEGSDPADSPANPAGTSLATNHSAAANGTLESKSRFDCEQDDDDADDSVPPPRDGDGDAPTIQAPTGDTIAAPPADAQ